MKTIGSIMEALAPRDDIRVTVATIRVQMNQPIAHASIHPYEELMQSVDRHCIQVHRAVRRISEDL